MIFEWLDPVPIRPLGRGWLIALALSAAVVPIRPGPGWAASESYVRGSLSLPLAPLRNALDRALPADTLVKTGWEPVEDEAAEIRMRWTAVRGPLRVTPHRDTLLATALVKYRIEARGSGPEVVTCGSGTPLTAEVGVLTRLGWRADWGLEARSTPLATLHSEGCEPKPPGVNFTEVVAPRLDAMFHPLMGTTLDSLVARDPRPRALVERIWSALDEPFPTRVPGLVLDFVPQRVLAASPVVSADRMTADVAVVVTPRLLWNEPAARKTVPLPDNQVRIAGDMLEIRFDVSAPFDSLRRRALARCASNSGPLGALRVVDLRLSGDGGRLIAEARTSGSGTLRLTGAVVYDPIRHTIGASALGPDAASVRIAHAAPGGDQALAKLRDCLEEGLQQDITDWLVITSTEAGRALNRDLAPGIRIEGGIFERRADRVEVESTGIRARMIAAGKGRIVAEAGP